MTAEIQRLAGDPPSPYETAYGFSRVVVVGGLAMVGGTTSVGPSGTVLGETPYEQTIEILRRVLHEFSRVGVMPEDVVSLRVYVTDTSRAEEVARAFSEVLGSVRPLMTLVGVAGLIDPRMWVEIETVAVAPESFPGPGGP